MLISWRASCKNKPDKNSCFSEKTLGRTQVVSQINEILGRHHSDYATLRRELIGYQLMERENGFYWRLPAALWKSETEIMKQTEL